MVLERGQFGMQTGNWNGENTDESGSVHRYESQSCDLVSAPGAVMRNVDGNLELMQQSEKSGSTPW